jgi:serine/threonine-protein kinase
MRIPMGTSFETLPRPFGLFTLVRLIAQGGMGQVFLALRPIAGESCNEVCVVKTVRTDLKDDREAIGRFLDEARVVSKLDHAAICHTLDAGVLEKTYYLAMEFISGRNLRDIQTRAHELGRPVPEALIFHALAEMLDALAYAHGLSDQGTGEHLHIVHRDVSPHNVMLGFDGYVKLIDFGLAAHELKRELTRPGIMVGKLRYNAPEQVRDRAIDGRSDLYSAGVMLYELLAGERFYDGFSEEDIWRVAMKGVHRPRLFSSLPQDIRAILDLCLTATPEERFATAADMKIAVIDAARSRNVREMRRASARFMGELFVEERQTERDMILQATGLAEARTRLIAVPSGTPSASLSSVGRTTIVSPAQVRGRLMDVVSGFDPDAETAFPQRPEVAPDASLAPSPSGSGRSNSPSTPSARSGSNIAEHATVVRQKDALEPPVAALKLKLRATTVANVSSATASRPRPAPWSAAFVVSSAALLLAGIAAVLAWSLVGDAGVEETVVRASQPAEEQDLTASTDAGEEAAPAVAEVADAAAVDIFDAGMPSIAKVAIGTPRSRPKKPPKPAKPPVRELKTLRDQAGYLRAFCMERVACARSMTESAAQLVTLSAAETKQLMQQIPKCIARCQR